MGRYPKCHFCGREIEDWEIPTKAKEGLFHADCYRRYHHKETALSLLLIFTTILAAMILVWDIWEGRYSILTIFSLILLLGVILPIWFFSKSR